MALFPGSRLGPYEITAQIGEGGMGEVYRATDTNLKRQVAIKVLPAAVAADAERLTRFQREAEVLASLNHPNIAAIYGIERSGSTTALVMELVEGPTLADRIVESPIPVDEALPIAKQIAEALESAHEQGIVHRDLKPANVKVRPDGTVKVLDFGLAKAVDAAPAGVALSMSPTITSPAQLQQGFRLRQGSGGQAGGQAMTQAGAILGTAAYMSPEQARGKRVDRRTDIWAFGCVFYEMLTGRRAFEAEELSLTLAEIVKSEPRWEALPRDTPAGTVRILRACLEKDPRRRLRDLGDLPLIGDEGASTSGRPDRVPHLSWWVAGGVLGGAAIGAAIMWLLAPTPPRPPGEVVRFSIDAPAGVMLGAFTTPTMVLSPDGQTLVFVGNEGGQRRLYRRRMNEADAAPISGTEEAFAPFFSPDGREIGFFRGGARLMRVSLTGGPPRDIGPAGGRAFGATWMSDGTIVFASLGVPGLQRVSADGGEPPVVTTGGADRIYQWPDALPGVPWIVAGAVERDTGARSIVLVSRETGEAHELTPGAYPRYVESRRLVYARDDAIWTVGFDVETLAVVGVPQPVMADIALNEAGQAPFAVARSGSLVFASGAARTEAIWMSASGTSDLALNETGPFVDPRLSPDGTRLALSRADRNQDVWLFDLVRDNGNRLTTQPGADMAPIWDASGERLTYTQAVPDDFAIVQVSVDGASEAPQPLSELGGIGFPSSWSPDGRYLAYVVIGVAGDSDIRLFDIEGEDAPLVATAFDERDPEIAPNGQWIAYTSDRSGRSEVYVTSFPIPGATATVSSGGGFHPVWSPTGDRLFYRTDRQVVAIEVMGDGRFGMPQPLFEAPVVGGFMRAYDVAPDGERFLMLRPASGFRSQLHVILNWATELEPVLPVE